ncbi:unnamed protein product [Parajaminaea phylloscopi]
MSEVKSTSNEGSSTLSTPSIAGLEPFLLLAKASRGAAAAKLVFEATAAPGCYVFSELAETEGVRQLAAEPEHASSTALLNLFLFGTIGDFVKDPSRVPALSQAHLNKLRQLSLVSLASRSRVLRYSELLDALHLHVYIGEDGSLRYDGLGSSSSTREPTMGDAQTPINAASMRLLEDVVIESMYAGLLSGRLDQKRAKLHVDTLIGRDVGGDEELRQMELQLREWNDATTALLCHLSDRIEATKQQAHREYKARERRDDALARSLKALSSSAQQHGGGGAYEGGGTPAWSASGWGATSDDMDLDEGPATGMRSANKKKNKRTRT